MSDKIVKGCMDLKLTGCLRKFRAGNINRASILFFLMLFGLSVSLFSGCARQPGEEKAASKKTTIEVSVFEGGFGLDYFLQVARDYEKLHPDIKVNLWGDPRNAEKLRPRFIIGNPPDVFWGDLPVWKLITNNQLYPLNEILETKAYGQDKKWKDTIYPGLVDGLKYEGKIYGIPTDFSIWVIWYNKGMFEEHGWRIPETWTEFLQLCEDIKKAGIAPIAFQGRYPSYMAGTLEALFQRIGGLKAVYDAQNLVPGAWEHPAFLDAAGKVQELVNKGYLQKGCMGMSHTEAQMEFVRGKTAMVTCGTWLKSEMSNVLPEGFQMACFGYPAVEGGKGDPTAVQVGCAFWCIPADAKHPKLGADFLKFLTSLENAKRFVREKAALYPVIGSDESLSEELATAVELVKKAAFTWDIKVGRWYPEWRTEYSNAITGLLTEELTPEQFVKAVEEAAARVRENPTIVKHRVEYEERAN